MIMDAGRAALVPLRPVVFRRFSRGVSCQCRKTLPSVTVMEAAASGVVAGPVTTAPLVILNLLPWHGQLIVPSATWLHMHPTWVQMALNALCCPLAGWVTTTWAAW